MKLLASPYTFLRHFCDFYFNYYPTVPTLNDVQVGLKSVEPTVDEFQKMNALSPREPHGGAVTTLGLKK